MFAQRFFGQCPICKTTAPAKFIKSYVRAGHGFTNPKRVKVYECSNCGGMTAKVSEEQSEFIIVDNNPAKEREDHA